MGNIQDFSNPELLRRYAELLIEIDNKYASKKEFEEELKKRLRNGGLTDGKEDSD